METINSFKGYGKVDPAEEQAFRRKSRKRLIILIVSLIVLVAVIIGAVVGVVVHKRNAASKDAGSSSGFTPAASLKAVCRTTLYPDSCYSSISSIESSNSTDPEIIFGYSLQVALEELSKLIGLPSKLKNAAMDARLGAALDVCESLFEDAVDRLNDSVSSMKVEKGEKLLTSLKVDSMRTWLSTAVTDQETCLDALEELKQNSSKYENSVEIKQLKSAMKNSTEYSSNSLAIASKILGLLADFNFPIHRRLLGFQMSPDSGFPSWVGHGDRRLLQENNPIPNVTVALDGSGNFKTVKEAVGAVPKKSLSRFVIHVKAGTYLENVILDKSKWNVMIYGDGNTKTIISGSLNFIDGTPTYATATLAVQGKGFIAKDIKFINEAGAAKHQAVAFRSGSDLSVFYRCSFDGFQDTLYAHSNRQFYKECDITGTIDFIFGNAAVVFQNCNIQPRQPMSNQFNTITAQGKKDPNQNTGISIHKCIISSLGTVTALTYLGRPWKDFSTTVVLQSNIGPILHPSGWMSWVANVEPPSTILYGEYQNTGPGSGVDKRVKWTGYKAALTDNEAGKFTVGTFIQGADWLPATNVMYDATLN